MARWLGAPAGTGRTVTEDRPTPSGPPLPAAFLWAQLERFEWLNEQRVAVWERYHEGYEQLEGDGALRRPVVPEGARHNAHLYYLLLPDEDRRQRLIEELARRQIASVFHYV